MSTAPLPVTDGGLILDRHRLPADLYALLANGGQLTYLGRQSSHTASARAAEQNLRAGAAALRPLGIDGTAVLPGTGALAEQLTRQGRRLYSPELGADRDFINKVQISQWSEQVSTYLSTGSGLKIDAETLDQPVVKDLALFIAAHRIALICLHELTRLGRGGYAYAPLIHVLQAQAKATGTRPWVAFRASTAPGAPMRLLPFGRQLAEEMFAAGEAGAVEAEQAQIRYSGGRIEKTGPAFVGGRVLYGQPWAPPPGAYAVRLADDTGRRPGPRIVYLDTEGNRPEPAHLYVAAERELLRLPYQLDLVSDLLQNRFCKPGFYLEEAADYLQEAGYRPASLITYGANPGQGYARRSPKGQTHASRILSQIIDAVRDETYLLKRWVTSGTGLDGARVTITDFGFPDGRPVYTLARHRAILEALDEGLSRRRRRSTTTFSGLPVNTQAGPARLYGVTGPDGQVSYYAHDEQDIRRRRAGRRDPIPGLPHLYLAASVLEALASAPLRALDYFGTASRDEQERAERAYAALQQRITKLTGTLTKLRANLAGNELTGAALRDLNAEYNSLDGSRESAQRQLMLFDQQSGGELIGPDLELTMALVAALGDPRCITYRPQLLVALNGLHVEPIQRGPGQGRRGLRWYGVFRLNDGQTTWLLDVKGQILPGPLPQPPATDPRVIAGVAAMREGVPMAAWTRSTSYFIRGTRQALGIGPGERFVLARVQDPRLLRAGMAIAYPPLSGRAARHAPDGLLAGPPLTSGQLPALAARTGEPLELLRRLHPLYVTDQPRTWLRRNAPAVAALLARTGNGRKPVRRADMSSAEFDRLASAVDQGAQAKGWSRQDNQVFLTPCPHCGGRTFDQYRNYEIDGPVCRKCRLDRSGVYWAAAPYRPYLVTLD